MTAPVTTDTPARRPRLVLAEDNALLRDGLSRLLSASGFEVATALAGSDGLAEALLDPTIEAALLDVRLPPTHTDEGLRAAIAARAARPGLPVMVLSQFVERLYARELLADRHGGVGYLLKDRVGDVADFVDSLRRVMSGATVIDPEVIAEVMARHSESPVDRLTPREREVLEAMAQGMSNAAIAAQMVITEKAVAKHINSLFAKLGLVEDADDHRRVKAVLAWLGV